uniref:Uncharacterized protein n=1 Tax=uncultured marine microorganism HF4000_APKG8K5 TaxID=455555 RepID=B3TB65_9ZZZZ|nr:hypothetical protein ALOHA_HF4000APKG8K5ctg1g5 [uncultured marine microorganism HF4000_APKG8K5]
MQNPARKREPPQRQMRLAARRRQRHQHLRQAAERGVSGLQLQGSGAPQPLGAIAFPHHRAQPGLVAGQAVAGQLPAVRQPVGVAVAGLHQFADALLFAARDAENPGLPRPLTGTTRLTRTAPMHERGFEVGLGGPGQGRHIGLGDGDDMGNLDDPRLHELQGIPRPRLHAEHDRIGDPRHNGLRLAHAHGFDQNHVVDGAHQHHRRNRQRRQPAQTLARGHGAHEHAVVLRVGGNARAVAKQRAAGNMRGRIHGDHPDAAARSAQMGDHRPQQGRFPDPGRAGHAHHMGPGGGMGAAQEGHGCRRFGSPLDPGQGFGQGGLVAPQDSGKGKLRFSKGGVRFRRGMVRRFRHSLSGLPIRPSCPFPPAPPAPPPNGRWERGTANRRHSPDRPFRRSLWRRDRRHVRRKCLD